MLDIKFKLEDGHRDGYDWKRNSRLRTIFWNATYACNFRCPLCFSDSGDVDSSEMTTDDARRFLCNAKVAGVSDIVLSGGEPFVRSDMFDLLVYMKDIGLGARAASNGSQLTEDLLKRLRDETSLRSFMISLDSIDPDIYSIMHGVSKSLLDDTISKIRCIRNLGFHTTVSVRITPLTLPGLTELLDFAADEHIHTVTGMIPVNFGRVDANLFWQPDTDLFVEMENIFVHFASMSKRWRAELHVPWAQYHPVIRRLSDRVPFSFVDCLAGRSSLVVQPSGRVVPCLCMDVPQAELGNVLTGDIIAMFRDSFVCKLMRNPREHGICDWCENVESCGGGCRSTALAITGRMNADDPYCPIVRERRAKSGRVINAE